MVNDMSDVFVIRKHGGAVLRVHGVCLSDMKDISANTREAIFNSTQDSDAFNKISGPVIADGSENTSQVLKFARKFGTLGGGVIRAGKTLFIQLLENYDQSSAISKSFKKIDYQKAIDVIQFVGLPKSLISEVRQSIEKLINNIQDPEVESRRTCAPTWRTRVGVDRKLTPPEFIQKYYGDKIGNGTLTQAYIRKVDESLYWAYHNWRRSSRSGELNKEFSLPSSYKSREETFREEYGDNWEESLEAKRRSDRERVRRSRLKRQGTKL